MHLSYRMLKLSGEARSIDLFKPVLTLYFNCENGYMLLITKVKHPLSHTKMPNDFIFPLGLSLLWS